MVTIKSGQRHSMQCVAAHTAQSAWNLHANALAAMLPRQAVLESNCNLWPLTLCTSLTSGQLVARGSHPVCCPTSVKPGSGGAAGCWELLSFPSCPKTSSQAASTKPGV
jgi:hypothetical protein